mgnify:CR=1 FL=1|tara:strand:+ start:1136 stop:1639 length:504 start_codon:yes stop_codon:yes gene_type:complete
MARGKGKFSIEVKSDGIVKLVNELINLGDPKWVMGRYKAASKKALEPVLSQIIATAPNDSGALAGSFISNAKNSKAKKGRTDARVGIGKMKFFVVKGKLVRRAQLINAIEFSKKGHPGQGFIRTAMASQGSPKDIKDRMKEFLAKAVAKRARFNTRPRKARKKRLKK